MTDNVKNKIAGTGGQSHRRFWEFVFVAVLVLYPLRHIAWGLDLWDTGYGYANFEYMGTSASGLDSIIKNCNPTAEKIEQIADFFQLPIDYFFDRNNPGNITSIGHQITGDGNRVTGDIGLSECQKEIEHLRQLLAAKEETIETQRELIKSLKK